VGLIFVPTPLGNLRDITLRALDTLRDCNLLVAEDTRVAMRLLQALGLPSKTIWSYREANAAAVTDAILARARTEMVALTTDAGTPGISDPGRDLIVAARDGNVSVEVLPGPCAFVCAAVLSGFPLTGFSFEGFMARAKGERERAFRAAFARGTTAVWYESPRRIGATLETLAAIAPSARLFLARELTKRYEQQIAGTPAALATALGDDVRGEITLVLDGSSAHERTAAGSVDLEREIDLAFEAGGSVADVARELARRGLGPRGELYALARKRRDERDPRA